MDWISERMTDSVLSQEVGQVFVYSSKLHIDGSSIDFRAMVQVSRSCESREEVKTE
jgi:hypothetical protein